MRYELPAQLGDLWATRLCSSRALTKRTAFMVTLLRDVTMPPMVLNLKSSAIVIRKADKTLNAENLSLVNAQNLVVRLW